MPLLQFTIANQRIILRDGTCDGVNGVPIHIIIKKIGTKKAQILFDADGSGRKAAIEIATVNYEPNARKMGGALDHTDFFII